MILIKLILILSIYCVCPLLSYASDTPINGNNKIELKKRAKQAKIRARYKGQRPPRSKRKSEGLDYSINALEWKYDIYNDFIEYIKQNYEEYRNNLDFLVIENNFRIKIEMLIKQLGQFSNTLEKNNKILGPYKGYLEEEAKNFVGELNKLLKTLENQAEFTVQFSVQKTMDVNIDKTFLKDPVKFVYFYISTMQKFNKFILNYLNKTNGITKVLSEIKYKNDNIVIPQNSSSYYSYIYLYGELIKITSHLLYSCTDILRIMDHILKKNINNRSNELIALFIYMEKIEINFYKSFNIASTVSHIHSLPFLYEKQFHFFIPNEIKIAVEKMNNFMKNPEQEIIIIKNRNRTLLGRDIENLFDNYLKQKKIDKKNQQIEKIKEQSNTNKPIKEEHKIIKTKKILSNNYKINNTYYLMDQEESIKSIPKKEIMSLKKPKKKTRGQISGILVPQSKPELSKNIDIKISEKIYISSNHYKLFARVLNKESKDIYEIKTLFENAFNGICENAKGNGSGWTFKLLGNSDKKVYTRVFDVRHDNTLSPGDQKLLIDLLVEAGYNFETVFISKPQA